MLFKAGESSYVLTCESRTVDKVEQGLDPTPVDIQQELKGLLEQGISTRRVTERKTYRRVLKGLEGSLVPCIIDQLLLPLIPLVQHQCAVLCTGCPVQIRRRQLKEARRAVICHCALGIHLEALGDP